MPPYLRRLFAPLVLSPLAVWCQSGASMPAVPQIAGVPAAAQKAEESGIDPEKIART